MLDETSNSTPRPRYWFAAKRYGWGWGLPTAWQGWVVLIAWTSIVVGLSPGLAAHHPAAFVAMIIVMSALLIGICYAKGEPVRWRWGK